MSNIFEALQKESEQVPQEVLSSLFDGQARPDSDRSPVIPLQPVSDIPVPPVHPVVPPPRLVPPQNLTAAGTEPELQWARMRSIPITVNGAVPLLPFDDPNSGAAEQYRIIRTRIVQHPRQPGMLLISSAGPADGKSLTAINLAGALSLKSEARVLLMDTDFRRSTIHSQLSLPLSPGLSEVLSGTAALEEAIVRVEQLPNLYVIPAGEPRPNPSELLDSTRWLTICRRLREMFRYVIADSPPVASVADYELLQAASDGIILVARPDHTNRLGFSKALELVPEAKLIGVVMNCVPEWFLGRNYYYAPYYYGNGRKS